MYIDLLELPLRHDKKLNGSCTEKNVNYCMKPGQDFLFYRIYRIVFREAGLKRINVRFDVVVHVKRQGHHLFEMQGLQQLLSKIK